MLLKKYKNDILLILALLVLAGGIWLYLVFTREDGAKAVVTLDGETVAVLPLSEDTVRVFGTESAFNAVTVKDGFVFVNAANCSNQLCVHQGKIRYDGETIVCLPHKLIVSVKGGDGPEADAVSW